MTRLNLLTSIAVAALTLNTGIAIGAPKAWNGSVSGAWNVAANWTPSGVPVAGDDITVPDVTNQPTFNGTGSVANSFESLTLQTGAEMIIDGLTTGVEFIINDPAGGSPTSLAIASGAHLDLFGTEPVLTLETAMDVTIGGSTARILIGASSTDGRIVVEAASTFTVASGGAIASDPSSTDAKIMVEAATVFDTTDGGLIQLSGTSPVFIAAADVGLTGDGAFQMGATSTVQINANADLTNALVGGIVGRGTINGVAGVPPFGTNGRLINNSFVEASGGATAVLMLTSTLLVEDIASSDWLAADSATLKFFRSLPDLDGNFTLPVAEDGIFHFAEEVDVVTTGSFICEGDGVRIDTNASFTFAGGMITSDCDCGICPESP